MGVPVLDCIDGVFQVVCETAGTHSTILIPAVRHERIIPTELVDPVVRLTTRVFQRCVFRHFAETWVGMFPVYLPADQHPDRFVGVIEWLIAGKALDGDCRIPD